MKYIPLLLWSVAIILTAAYLLQPVIIGMQTKVETINQALTVEARP